MLSEVQDRKECIESVLTKGLLIPFWGIGPVYFGSLDANSP